MLKHCLFLLFLQTHHQSPLMLPHRFTLMSLQWYVTSLIQEQPLALSLLSHHTTLLHPSNECIIQHIIVVSSFSKVSCPVSGIWIKITMQKFKYSSHTIRLSTVLYRFFDSGLISCFKFFLLKSIGNEFGSFHYLVTNVLKSPRDLFFKTGFT